MKRFTVITELNDYRKLYWVLAQNKLPLTVIWESYFLAKYDICIYTGFENQAYRDIYTHSLWEAKK